MFQIWQSGEWLGCNVDDLWLGGRDQGSPQRLYSFGRFKLVLVVLEVERPGNSSFRFGIDVVEGLSAQTLFHISKIYLYPSRVRMLTSRLAEKSVRSPSQTSRSEQSGCVKLFLCLQAGVYLSRTSGLTPIHGFLRGQSEKWMSLLSAKILCAFHVSCSEPR